MATTKEDIRGWFEDGVKKGATHMIVVCDTYDHEDFPVYVMPGESVHKEFDKHREPNIHMEKVMEVYSLDVDMEFQLNERMAFHF
ncbi:MAG: hypothetical protein Q8R29_02715 [bacterium]|nr:hypothetical protein [bacterium]